jgi:hypothetical protein
MGAKLGLSPHEKYIGFDILDFKAACMELTLQGGCVVYSGRNVTTIQRCSMLTYGNRPDDVGSKHL